MTAGEKNALLAVSRLLEYPDDALLAGLPEILREAELEPAAAETVGDFCARLEALGPQKAREDYVAVFDHDPAGSLYLSWHRYGNDRSQGRAMAGLNGLYRAAGFEPQPGAMPDYLPRMLEFLAVCDEWAQETLLDGFGPEMAALEKHLLEARAPQAPLLALALEPLKRRYPARFRPRGKFDSTLRPLARPEPEMPL